MNRWLFLGLVCGLGCAYETAPDRSTALPKMVSNSLESCADTPYPELANMCRLRFAVRLSHRGEEARTWEVCTAIDSPLWRDECHFLVAEALAHHANIASALDHCALAGRYSRHCGVHIAWGKRPFSSTASPASADSARSIARTLEDISAASRDAAAPAYQRDLAVLSASFWFELYFGSGLADPTAARAVSGPLGVDARTAFAWEAVRLVGPEVGVAAKVAHVLDIWEGRRPPLRGTPLPVPCWQGRNTHPFKIDALGDAPMTHLPHYGMRFVGETEEEDLLIATLEGTYFEPRTSSGAFGPWLDDPRPRVQAAAAHLELLVQDPSAPFSDALKRTTSGWRPDRVATFLKGHNRALWRGPGDNPDCP